MKDCHVCGKPYRQGDYKALADAGSHPGQRAAQVIDK